LRRRWSRRVSRKVEVMGDGRRVVGAVGDVMMTAWGCRDDEGREKAGKIQGPRFRVRESGFKMQDSTANGCASMLDGEGVEGGIEGGSRLQLSHTRA
jgi:hypothetical protein